MRFDPTLTVGNLLTVGTVLASALTLAYALVKDRKLRHHEAAERVRAAAARTLTGLMRWRDRSSSFNTIIDPLFVEASEALVAGKSVALVKSELWKAIMIARKDALEVRSAENLEAAYTGLLAYDPQAYRWVLELVETMAKLDEEWFIKLIDRTQTSLSSVRSGLTAPQVSNELRAGARWELRTVNEKISRHMKEAEQFLVVLIGQSDGDLVRRVPPVPPTVLGSV